LNPRQLRYFITIAAEGTFTKASSKLRVAQPALSRQIGLLEEELGTLLLVRHRRGVGLTEAGVALLERARPLLVSMDQIEADIRDYSAAPTGILRIGCTPTLTSRLVVNPVRRILDAFPKVTVQIQEGVSYQLCRAVLSDELDAAIVSENLAESFLTAEALFDEEVWLFGPPTTRKRASPIDIRRIAALPIIMTRAPQTTRRFVDRAIAQAGFQLNMIAESDSIQATREFLISGVGHTVAPCSALSADIDSGLLSGLPIRDFYIRRSLVRRNDRPMSRALQEFKTLLLDQVGSFAKSLSGVTVLQRPSTR
jgi:LysR family nitrogen assimilation transcriptional regulator